MADEPLSVQEPAAEAVPLPSVAPRPGSVALVGLFVLAIFFTLYIARALLLPLVLAFVLSFILKPAVRQLERLRLSSAVGAAIVVSVLLAAVVLGAWGLSGPAAAWIAKAPESLRQVEARTRPLLDSFAKFGRATARVEALAERADGDADRPIKAEVEAPSLSDTLFGLTWNLLNGGSVMFVLLFFLLAAGDLFLLKLVRVLPRLQDKKRAVLIVKQVEQDVSRYLATITLINVGLGVVVALLMYALGMPNPVLWGVMAGVTNYVPYLSAIFGTVIMGLAALLTFEDMGRALAVPALFMLATSIEGSLVTPLVVGRRLTLNPVVVFVSLMLWWWIWGITGALLAVPLLSIFKILCDHLEPLAPIGEFIGS